MKVIILAGGGGTRLFPMSRTCYPKQFLKIAGHKSLLVQTLERFMLFVRPEDIVVITNQDYYFFVKAELESCGAQGASIVCEPASRNTAPAIALAIKYCEDKLESGVNETLFVAPSDHIIKPAAEFAQLVQAAAKAAGCTDIITLGVKPDKPETGYGYINAYKDESCAYTVKSFKEKPDSATAQQYLHDGSYFWNAGLFAFSISAMKHELKAYCPDIMHLYSLPYEEMLENFHKMPQISIDYAVMEKSQHVKMLPLTIYWNDIGSWDALYDVLEKDDFGNTASGSTCDINCTNTMLISNNKLVAAIGLDNISVIETADAILVAKRGDGQQVKELVDLLKKKNPTLVHDNITMCRPWGSYTILSEGENYKVKKIVINPGCKISLQMHYHRSEHWTVINGIGKLTQDNKVIFFKENESTFIPASTRHRLENPGKLPLSIIEVQTGRYLGEDDIVRFDDVYGRTDDESEEIR